MRSLVVFYSRTGNTSLIAHKIAALLHADTDRILSRTAYDSRGGYIRAAFQSLADSKVAIEEAKASPANYDLVVIGGPVWFWRAACPVRTYLREHRAHLGRTAYFVTQGGRSPLNSLTQMEAISSRRPLATLSVSEKEIAGGTYEGSIRAFVGKIKSAMGSERQSAA